MPIGFVNGGGGNSPEELFRSIPPVSKVVIVGMVGSMLSLVVGMATPYDYALSWPLVWNKFHLWRLFTSGVFPGEPGYSALITIFSMGMFSIRYVWRVARARGPLLVVLVRCTAVESMRATVAAVQLDVCR